MNSRPSKPRPTVPLPEPVAAALQRNVGLTALHERLARSANLLAAVRDELPAGLRDDVRSGPIDDEGWSVLASNAAVAAKLRHLLPRMQAVLRARGEPDIPIRIRIRRGP